MKNKCTRIECKPSIAICCNVGTLSTTNKAVKLSIAPTVNHVNTPYVAATSLFSITSSNQVQKHYTHCIHKPPAMPNASVYL